MNISGLDKAVVLAVLYNRARPQGMGFLQYDPTPWTTEDAQAYINSAQGYPLSFDYVKGRVMKVNLERDEVDTGLYNRDNGANAAENALADYKRTGVVSPLEVLIDQHNATEAAKRDLKNMYGTTIVQQTTKGVREIHLGLDPVIQDVMEKRLEELEATS